MSSRDAIRKLQDVGFVFLRRGKGDHIIMQKGMDRVVLPDGKKELNSGMVRRVDYTIRKHGGKE